MRVNANAARTYSMHTTGYAFDIARAYGSRRQAAAFQLVLDRLAGGECDRVHPRGGRDPHRGRVGCAGEACTARTWARFPACTSSCGSCRRQRSTRRATPSSRRAPAGSASTSAAPGTRRERERSSRAKAPIRRSAKWGGRSACAELRVETVVPLERAEAVVRALREAHPYEEVAFELYAIVDVAQ